MTDVAVIGFAQSPFVRAREPRTTSGVEMLVPIFAEVLQATGLTKDDIGFWCSGSSDYLAGRAFSFVSAVDAIGAFPPVMESHVEMDGAWALYEAWVKILTGDADIALAYGFGKSSAGDLRRVLALQLDPYLLAPLWPDSVSIAALQARLGHRGRAVERGRDGRGRGAQPRRRGREPAGAAVRRGLRREAARPALRRRPAPRARLRAGRRRRRGRDPGLGRAGPRAVPAARLDHRVRAPDRLGRARGARPDHGAVGAPPPGRVRRDAGAGVDVAELHAPFTHQEILLRGALGLGDDVRVNPSGGVLCGNPMFAAGLARIGLAAQEIMSGRADRALAHATSGPALQQNLVCVMEARG